MRCFFSAGDEGINDSPWPMVGHGPPVDNCADLRSKDLVEGVQEEDLRALDSEEEKQPGVRLTVLTALWLEWRFGWWSTVGVGAAWSSSLWSEDVLLLLLMELGLPLKEIQG